MEKIQTKLTAIQAELKAPKNQFNSFGKYKYRSCEDILEAVKPLLVKHGASLYISDYIEHQAGRFYVVAKATLQVGDQSISVEGIAREPEEKKGMDASQITGAASSYARKYALAGLFLLDDTKDADHHPAASKRDDQDRQIAEDIIAEITACDDLKELEAHYKANEDDVKRLKLGKYYTAKKAQLK